MIGIMACGEEVDIPERSSASTLTFGISHYDPLMRQILNMMQRPIEEIFG